MKAIQEIQLRIVTSGGTRQDTVPHQHFDALTVGRGEDNQVVIDERGISRRHCRFCAEDGQLFVEDLQSTSGTYLFDQQIKRKQPINDGDSVFLGPVELQIKIVQSDPAGLPGVSGSLGDKLEEEDFIPAKYRRAKDDEDQMGQTVIAPDDVVADSQAAVVKIELAGDELTLGRDADCDVPLEGLMISRRHAQLQRKGRAWFVRDLGSTNGTFVNGQRLSKPFPLDMGDVLKIGPYELVFEGPHLISRSLDQKGIRIEVRHLNLVVKDAKSGQPNLLLDDVSLVIEPGDFVGLLGSSGAGKSLLIEGLNGRRPGTDGDVRYNDDSICDDFDAYKSQIGYVPQELIFHDALPLADALRYASRLRLSDDVSDKEIEANIDRVLETVGLSDRKNTVIKHLSGGQKKRVSIAIELISKPSLLFLDEVTSGLDVGTEREMMMLFRKLADGGVTVVCISHHLDHLMLCHKLALMMQGKLIFFGPSRGLLKHFQISSLAEIFGLETARTADQWRQEYKSSRYHRVPDTAVSQNVSEKPPSVRTQWDPYQFKRQLSLLTRRYVQLLTLDRTMPMILIGLAPLIGLLLCVLTSSITYTNPPMTPADYVAFQHTQHVLGFGSILTVLFLGLFGSVQEVVKELRVYRHERFVCLQILPYVLSKIGPLAAVGAIQTVLLLAVIRMVGGFDLGNLAQQLIILVSTNLAGVTLGLAISAAVPGRSVVATGRDPAMLAIMAMNAFVIPQILFAGVIAPLKGAPELFAKTSVTAYWAFEAFEPLLVEKLPMVLRPALDPSHWLASVGMILLHVFICMVAFFAAMVHKEGPGGFAKLAKAIPRDEKGRIAAKQLIDKAKQLMNQTQADKKQ